MGVMLRVKGRWACFTRPELKVEMVTYDVMTPTAAKAILGCIYRKPEMEWVVDGIHVINPIKTITLMRNGITETISSRNVLRGKQIPFDVSSMRDQRNATILYKVDYVIKAHFDVFPGNEDAAKHYCMFTRRASQGQCFRHPYFGCREFSVDSFELVKEIPPSSLKGTMQLGYMIHSFDHERDDHPAFFNAILEDGYLKVPPLKDPRVKR